MAWELSPETAARIHREFQKVLDSAAEVPDVEQVNLFGPDREVAKQLRKMLYQPMLEFARAPGQSSYWPADKQAQHNVALLQRVLYETELICEGAVRDMGVASLFAWKAVFGRYYTRRPLAKSWAKEEFEALQLMKDRDEYLVQRFARVLLGGNPVAVSNFYAVPHYVLCKVDGTRARVMTLTNNRGEFNAECQLDSRSFSRPSELQTWMGDQGNYLFLAGEHVIQFFKQDVYQALAFKDVEQVDSFGALRRGDSLDGERPDLWLFGDCAMGDGLMIKPAKNGVIWHKYKGYVIGEHAGRKACFGQDWKQKPPPLMHPEIAGCEAVGEDFRAVKEKEKRRKGESPSGPSATALGEFFSETAQKVFDWLCSGGEAGAGMQAFAAMGGILAFGAGPEIFYEYGQFPGIFIAGQTQTGKSTWAKLLMEFWGFHRMGDGISLKTGASRAGMQWALMQNRHLPVWINEFHEQLVDKQVQMVLLQTFQHGDEARHRIDGQEREIRTNFLVTGETSSSDAAIRSRYLMCQTADQEDMGRIQPVMDWLQRNRGLFFLFGRFVLEHRAEFTAKVLVKIRDWIQQPETRLMDGRSVFVHGVAYAAFATMAEMLGSRLTGTLKDFRKWLIVHCERAMHETHAEVNVNRTWADIAEASAAGEVPLDCFKSKAITGENHPPDAPNQTGWKKQWLYINPKAVLDHTRIYLRKQGRELPLEQGDFQAQIRETKYWVEGPHRIHFVKGSKHCATAWCIDLDWHPMGRRAVSDDEWEAARIARNGESDEEFKTRLVPRNFDDGDPRMGPLYAIIHRLEEAR